MSEVETKTKSPDPRVATAISHWAPRFVSNGVLLADFEEVAAGIERWEDWCRAWCERAKVHKALGREALAQGYKLTAGEHLVRAAMYYHFAKFVFVHDKKQMRDAHLQSVECYKDALPLMRPTGERVAIPFEGKTLYAILRHPLQRFTRSPVLIMAPGLDSTKEELHAYAEPFLARGIAIVAIDGPGPREAFRVRSHCATEAEALSYAATLSMNGAAEKIACPIFIVAGREDRLVPASHAERLAKSVSGPVELLIVEDGGHNANNRPYRYRSRTADWLAGQLGLPRI